MEERQGYNFEIRFNPETNAMTTSANIPFGLMAKGIGATLSRLNLTEEEFASFMLGLVTEFDTSNKYKGTNDEQSKKNN